MALPKPLSTSCLEIIVQGVMAGQACLNIYHYQGVQPVSGDTLSYDLLDLVTIFATDIWIDDVMPLVSEAYSVERYIGREISGNRYVDPNDPESGVTLEVRQFVELGGGEDDTGDLVGDFLPTFNAATFYMQTNQHGRHGAGHTRVAGLMKTDIKATPEGNKLADARWTAWNAIKADFATRILNPGVGADTAVPCLFWKTPVVKQVIPTIDDMRPYMKLYNTVTTRRLVTSQVSRKAKNRGGL